MVLAVKPNGDVFVDDQPVTLETLGDAVKKATAGTGRSLQMKADTDANFGKVMAVLDVLHGAGVADVSTLTQEKK